MHSSIPVDKKLLDMPEDEIDYRSLPIKDLIILAEVRERIAVKILLLCSCGEICL